MIKINRNIQSQKIIDAKDVLNKEKAKASGSYNKPEVIEALKEISSSKCYICENKKITSYNIEHFRPHKNENIDLKFDFNNMLLACGHCNNIKLDNYENLIDCSKEDVDELIAFRKTGNFSWNEKIEITPLKHSIEIDETVDLLEKVYNGTTALKKLESSNIRKELRDELLRFNDILNEYWEAEGEDKEDAKFAVKRHLKSSSAFAAFKRWIIRDNKEILSVFLMEDGMKVCVN